MKDTTKSHNGGFKLTKVMNIITGEESYRIDDGYSPITAAELTTYSYYKELEELDLIKAEEVFTTEDGIQYLYFVTPSGYEYIAEVKDEK